MGKVSSHFARGRHQPSKQTKVDTTTMYTLSLENDGYGLDISILYQKLSESRVTLKLKIKAAAFSEIF